MISMYLIMMYVYSVSTYLCSNLVRSIRCQIMGLVERVFELEIILNKEDHTVEALMRSSMILLMIFLSSGLLFISPQSQRHVVKSVVAIMYLLKLSRRICL